MTRFLLPLSRARGPRGLWRAIPLLLMAATLCSACYDTGWGGGRTTIAASYGTGFYRPWGYNYGAWGPNYWVGPPRGGFGRPPLAMRRGWGGRGMPSIPMRPRGGRRFGAAPGWRGGRRF